MIEMIERYAALIEAQAKTLEDYERRQFAIAMLYRSGGHLDEGKCLYDA